MNKTEKIETGAGRIGSAIGRGLIAGLAGTAAITLSLFIEKTITHKEPNFAPADAACKALGLRHQTGKTEENFRGKYTWT